MIISLFIIITFSILLYRIYSYYQIKNAIERGIEKAEDHLYSHLNIPIKSKYVYICNGKYKIWTVYTNDECKKTPVLLIHGFGGAGATWVPNIEKMFEAKHPIYIIDMLGFGRSSRANFSKDAMEAEDQFIESIKSWKQEMNINKMILIGHSFGGYLSAAYTIKYSNDVKELILVDPWGILNVPYDTHNNMYFLLWSQILDKIHSNKYIISPISLIRICEKSVGIDLLKLLMPDMAKKYELFIDDINIIYEYFYYINQFNPTGEMGFKSISDDFVYAKNPLIDRIKKINSDVSIWFIYGEKSWISSVSEGKILSMLKKPYKIFNRFNRPRVNVKIIPNSGHGIPSEAPEEFNSHIIHILSKIK